MKLLLLLLSAVFCASISSAQLFQQAYTNNSYVPSGLLEAVAWTNTHMVHIENSTESCTGIPQPYGIMGLHDNGEGYFKETGIIVANLSGISIPDQKVSPENQIMAYAIAFNTLMIEEVGENGNYNDPIALVNILNTLSEIPNLGMGNAYAHDVQAYSILDFMNSLEMAQQYGFTQASFNLEDAFGATNYQVLSSPKVKFTETGIRSSNHDLYAPLQSKSAQYGPAIWNPADPCNFSSRSGTAISAITIHTIQGTYAGAISWAQNCASGVSYHYVIRSSDGQVTQVVLEEDKAWHVGTENPYTIGYEHEGYVNDPSWYTEEMYNSSADLSRDVVGSGYGIPPLRTYYGPSSVTTDLLGGCTKIKGHQHYPNQSHTDPGINWDWEKYYRLINNNPTIITLTAETDNFYDTGGQAGDYQDDERELWLIQPANAQDITLDFTVFNIESGYDNLYIYDGDNINAPLIGAYTGSNSPGTITSTGNSLMIEFRSDCATMSNGWEASYTTTLFDLTAPTTTIEVGAIWNTSDFTVDFTDTDTQSGIAERFYLVADKEVASVDWSSDGNFGFVNEAFGDNDDNWSQVTGAFTLASDAYSFSDENEQNSNTYLTVDQNDSYTYLYEWNQTITSNAGNQRAGMHFFCDNPNLPNRGNSYFVYLKETDNEVHIYSVDNDIFNLESNDALTISSGQEYNCKVLYSPTSGEIKVYIDDQLISSWSDPTPLTAGGFISLRTGGCAVTFDNIHVYKSRGVQAIVTASPSSAEMEIESEGAQPTGMIRSIVLDAANLWSSENEETYLLDFTSPEIDFLNDGTSADIDTFETATIDANWLAFDIHSDIASYDVAIGTLPNLDDVYPWTTNGASTAFTNVLASPIYDQVYHISLRATNNAGLTEQFISNGQRYVDDLGIGEEDLIHVSVYPNPASNVITITGVSGNFNIILSDASGKICKTSTLTDDEPFDISDLTIGIYNLAIQKGESFIVKKLQIQQ